MADGYYLTPDDYRALRAMMDQFRKGGSLVNRQSRGVYMDPDDAIQAPEVYIAKTPEGGIPAMEPGTGGDPDAPGSADCTVYRVVNEELIAVDGLTRKIYNLSENDIEGNIYITVSRDKFGIWTPAVAASVELSHGVIIAVCNEGCSTYRVQRVHRYLKSGCDDCGTGSGT